MDFLDKLWGCDGHLRIIDTQFLTTTIYQTWVPANSLAVAKHSIFVTILVVDPPCCVPHTFLDMSSPAFCFVSTATLAGFIYTIVPFAFGSALVLTACARKYARPTFAVAVTSLLYVAALLFVSCDAEAFHGNGSEGNPFVTFAVVAGIVWVNAVRRQQIRSAADVAAPIER